jgi:hypothetical protein
MSPPLNVERSTGGGLAVSYHSLFTASTPFSIPCKNFLSIVISSRTWHKKLGENQAGSLRKASMTGNKSLPDSELNSSTEGKL